MKKVHVILIYLASFIMICLAMPNHYVLECGHPPTKKYRELATEIGKLSYKLIKVKKR